MSSTGRLAAAAEVARRAPRRGCSGWIGRQVLVVPWTGRNFALNCVALGKRWATAAGTEVLVRGQARLITPRANSRRATTVFGQDVRRAHEPRRRRGSTAGALPQPGAAYARAPVLAYFCVLGS